MSEIALYNLLKRIPDATDGEVEKAVADVASSKDMATKTDIKDMATKSDIKDMATKTDIAELKAEMYSMHNKTIMWMVGVGLAIVGLIKYL